ncbi:MAG TPA: hypothetical protein VE442_02710 [Jatrophihabitans sp.]|jgi:F0F1-type ATP synthase membrane subunit c/vacuolar-type H+-ATPase subunit K|nr:hypothetical protein [Jatrophihabitans sp.]
MKKRIHAAALLAAILLPLAAAAPAYAAQPAVQGCVGSSVGAAAQQPGPFGQFVNGVAHDPTSVRPGVGDEVQTLAAGGLPDDEFPNTCNGG